MEDSGESKDTLRSMAAYLLGAVTTSTQKMREVVERLVKEGELTRQQGEKVLEEIEAKVSAGVKDAGRRGRAGAEKVMGAMGLATSAEVTKLAQRVAAIEERLGITPAEATEGEAGSGCGEQSQSQ